jgi:hypothetical protein
MSISPYPKDRIRIFEELPHGNPYFDIANAIRFVTPLKHLYTEDQRQAATVAEAYRMLCGRMGAPQDAVILKAFHRLAEEALKEYRKFFLDEIPTTSSAAIRDLIITQDLAVLPYFNNFYWMSLEYLYSIREEIFVQ